jgi:hypothetical protein
VRAERAQAFQEKVAEAMAQQEHIRTSITGTPLLALSCLLRGG